MLWSAYRFYEFPILVSESISTFAGASETAADNVPHCFARSTTCVNTTTDEKCDCTSHNVDRNVLELPKSNLFDSEERRKLIDAQKNLNLLLKPGILKLCGVLQLSV